MTPTPPSPSVREVAKIAASPSRPLSHAHMRLDLHRDTSIYVVRNVSKHIHVTLGKNEATLIIHPHAARRLIADIQSVLDGKDFAHD